NPSGSGGRSFPRAFTTHRNRTSSEGSYTSAAVRHRHTNAATSSKREHLFRSCGGAAFRKAAIAAGQKKKGRCSITSPGNMRVGHRLVLRVLVGGAQRGSCGEELPGPHGPHGRGGRAAHQLADGRHELPHARRIGQAVADLEAEDESSARQPQQRPVDYGGRGALRQAKKLAGAWDRRGQCGTEIIEPDVGVGPDEHDPLAGAIHHELPPGLLANPARDRVVKHQHIGESMLQNPDGVLRTTTIGAGRTVVEEVYDGSVEPEALLVVDVGERLPLAGRRLRRRDELRLASPRHESQRPRSHQNDPTLQYTP
ncbi:hypothetical protein ACMD2_11324, partial [Ananas comosus]